MDQIRGASNGNFVLGNERLATKVEAVIGRRVLPGKSGWPRKLAEPESGELFNG